MAAWTAAVAFRKAAAAACTSRVAARTCGSSVTFTLCGASGAPTAPATAAAFPVTFFSARSLAGSALPPQSHSFRPVRHSVFEKYMAATFLNARVRSAPAGTWTPAKHSRSS